ncbi:MAG: hypothetical protein ABL308_04335 [Oceanicaulis sp.]
MIETLGWIGTAGYLANHAAFSLYRRYPKTAYFAANLVSAAFLIASSFAIGSWHPVVNNGFWLVTSAVALSGMKPLGVRLKVPAARWLALVAGLVAAWLIATDLPLALEALGWVSVFTYAMAYLAFAAGGIGRESYLGANLAAALLQMPVLYVDGNWPVLALQAAWAGLSLAALMNRVEDAGTKPWLAELPPEVAEETDDDDSGRRP